MQTTTYIARPSQTNPGLFECFNTEREEVCATTTEQHAERLCRDYARRDAERLMEQEKRRMVEDNVIAALKAGGEDVRITETNAYGNKWRNISVYEPTSDSCVSVCINKMDISGYIYRISMGNVSREHTRSTKTQAVCDSKLLALVASGKAAKAAAHRRYLAYEASRNSVQRVVEASDSLLDKWGDGRLQNLGMVISVDAEHNGTDVKVTLSGHMTAERAAAIVEALRNLELVTA